MLSGQGSGGIKKKKFSGLVSFLTTDHWPMTTERGLTLIEVMLAVSVLSIGIVGVLRAYASSVATLESGQYNIDAVNLLKRKMADVQQNLLEQGTEASKSDSGNFEGIYQDFLWSWEIRPTDTDHLNELELAVSHNFNPRKISVITYVVDPPEEEE
ncbi:MAG: hypothetical protein A3C36_00910 [Omnitrophica WOR_2 bacterium RIFCSPHIGHO2_02_FULL_52_10]|nr:MAG: hypothetical protein A3C36_00910 [Omnitrophica WOR_2 bacterium RIFCSPHIGHO2_02_FULL_52_10]